MKDFSKKFERMNISDNANFNIVNPLFEKDSPYGKVAVSDQKTLYVHGEKMCGLKWNEEAIFVQKAYEKITSSATLVIGLGCGITLKEVVALRSPGETVDVIEINPVVVEAQQVFFEDNPVDAADVTLIVADAVSYLQTHQKDYDLILIDVSNPFSAESSGIYTSQFYGVLKNRLNENGLVAFWNFPDDIVEKDYEVEYFDLFEDTFTEAVKMSLENSCIFFSR